MRRTLSHPVRADPRGPRRAARRRPVGHRLQRRVSRAAAPLCPGRTDPARSARGAAAAAHEPIVAGPLRPARVRQERLRRARLRRARRRAADRPAQPAPVGRAAASGAGARHLQGVRQPRRRDVSRHRRLARAHEHAGDPDVGAWPRRASRPRDVRASRGLQLEARDAAVCDRRPLDLHRAEPPVPDGQPDRAQQPVVPVVHRPQCRRQAAHHPHRRPSRRHRGRHRRVRRRHGEDRPRARCRVRRVSGVRRRHLYVPRRLRAVGRRRRHGTSQQHGRRRRGLDQGQRARRARHRLARVLPRLERRAHPSEDARAVLLRGREHVRRAVAGRGLHAGTTGS